MRLSQYRFYWELVILSFISGHNPARSDFFVAALHDYVKKTEQEEERLAIESVETHFAHDRSEYGAVEGKYDCTNCTGDRERLCHTCTQEQLRNERENWLLSQMKFVRQFFFKVI